MKKCIKSQEMLFKEISTSNISKSHYALLGDTYKILGGINHYSLRDSR